MDKKNLTRAFVAIEFPDLVVKEVARIGGLIDKVKFTGKLTELENLHLTLRFLGEVNNRTLGEIKKRLVVIKFPKMKLKLGKIGTFSIGGNPSIVWIKVEGQSLYGLQKRVDEALSGLFAEREKFVSHLTIARIKYVMDKKGFLERLESIHVKPIEFEVSEMKLKKSELLTLGPIYGDLEVISYSE